MADIEKKTSEVAEKKAAKPQKAKKDKKPLGSRIAAWFRGFKAEFKKIVWVTPKNTAINTGIVLIVVIVVAAVIGALDLLFSGSILGLKEFKDMLIAS